MSFLLFYLSSFCLRAFLSFKINLLFQSLRAHCSYVVWGFLSGVGRFFYTLPLCLELFTTSPILCPITEAEIPCFVLAHQSYFFSVALSVFFFFYSTGVIDITEWKHSSVFHVVTSAESPTTGCSGFRGNEKRACDSTSAFGDTPS